MSDGILSILILTLPLVVGLVMLVRFFKRSPAEVLEDLRDEEVIARSRGLLDSDDEIDQETAGSLTGYTFHDDLAKAGLIENKERRQYQLRMKLVPMIFSFIFVLIALSIFSPKPPVLAAVALMGLAAGYIFSRVRLRSRQSWYIKQIEFYLPLLMERIVMAVQAGLDVVPALEAVISAANQEEDEAEAANQEPMLKLFEIVKKLNDSGIGFEDSLRHVAGLVECSSLRHAFIHLAMAYREGGEIVAPLRELSDSTQLYFQESVEEEIAKMPVRATMPLLCTFTGLIICFITSPMIQIISLLSKQLPK